MATFVLVHGAWGGAWGSGRACWGHGERALADPPAGRLPHEEPGPSGEPGRIPSTTMTSSAAPPDLPDERAAPEAGLARVAVGGVAWSGFSYLFGKVLVLVTTVVLARLLTPGDFGVVELALVFIAYVEGITDLGVAEALVYMPPGRPAGRDHGVGAAAAERPADQDADPAAQADPR